MSAQTSEAVQDYLKALHRLGGEDVFVSPTKIAELLKVKAPSVTGMLKRLADSSLIDYNLGKGAKLTAEGLVEARRVIRRHRLIELFLTKVLGLDWSEVEGEADDLEHAISPRLEQAIATFLGEPSEDPHGHLIPTASGELAKRDLRRLSECKTGDVVIVREAQDDNPARLRRWRELGLVPGTKVRILLYEPLDNLFEIETPDRLLRLGSDGLSGLRGELLETQV